MSLITNDRIVFFGTDAFSVPTLALLLGQDWNVVASVTKPDSQTGRGRELSIPAVKRVTLAKGLPVLQPQKVSEIIDELTALRPEIGIVVSYGKIIPASVIQLFPKGIVNIHASLLPRYRGASPIEATILGGDTITGVTLMQIDPGLDTGPLYTSADLPLTGTESRHQLYESLANLGAKLLAVNLPAILDGSLPLVPQKDQHATVTSLITKQQSHLDWSKKSAQQLEREVRAYLGWPGSHTKIERADIILTAVRAIPDQPIAPGKAYKTPTGELAISAKSGSLVIDRLKPAGKREMTGREFMAGHFIKPAPPAD